MRMVLAHALDHLAEDLLFFRWDVFLDNRADPRAVGLDARRQPKGGRGAVAGEVGRARRKRAPAKSRGEWAKGREIGGWASKRIAGAGVRVARQRQCADHGLLVRLQREA